MTHNFGKDEKLKSGKAFNDLFENGKSGFHYPIKVIYISKALANIDVSDELNNFLPKIGVAVPKKKFKTAVSRNLIKRRIKEAYRLNNDALKLLTIENKIDLDILFIYIAPVTEEYKKIASSMKKLINYLIENV